MKNKPKNYMQILLAKNTATALAKVKGKIMKNKEKFAEEILDIVCKGNEVAMDKDTMKLQSCDETGCEDCYFFEVNYPHNTGSCAKNFVHWANSEYKEKKEFSEADKAYVKAMDKLNWFARDKNGIVYGYVSKPFKNNGVWDVKAGRDDEYELERVSSYSSATVKPLSWDDDEPVHRSEILGE